MDFPQGGIPGAGIYPAGMLPFRCMCRQNLDANNADPAAQFSRSLIVQKRRRVAVREPDRKTSEFCWKS